MRIKSAKMRAERLAEKAVRDKEKEEVKKRREERATRKALAIKLHAQQVALKGKLPQEAPVKKKRRSRRRGPDGKPAPQLDSLLKAIKVARPRMPTWREEVLPTPAPTMPDGDNDDDVGQQAPAAASPTRRGDDWWDSSAATVNNDEAAAVDNDAAAVDIDVDVKPVIVVWERVTYVRKGQPPLRCFRRPGHPRTSQVAVKRSKPRTKDLYVIIPPKSPTDGSEAGT
jgi:hypothetical protein